MTEKVLLVDDETDFLSIMSERMKARGMDVSTATSAKEAIQLAESESFDAIILDLQMPGMDGLEALKVLKAKKPEIQVILLTGHATIEKGVEAMKLGAMDLMEKPADLKTLAEKIKKAQAKKMILVEKQTEEKMKEQEIEAGKLTSVGELASGIAHEINNPIAIMVEEAGWLSDLLNDEDLGNPQNLEEFRRALNQIKAQGGRCKDITHKLLFFAKKTDSRVREVQINNIIKEIVSISEERAKDSNVKIVTKLDPELPNMAASPSEMQQVMQNLVNNAIDAIGTGGGSIEITSRRNGEFVTIDVADTGQGIPDALMNRIFDPFFTTKPVGKGTGLGLSICYGIIKKMGGDITLDSSVGVGTTFHVHLPAPKSENQSHQ
ncbi:MAG: response regulator [Deltaproteobacteria bacterium]|nr:response regulator [Deltaproteobacteria bacterium]